jgi:hypothetical protein
VELRGFGSFRTRERGPRRGRNPKTGEPVDVPAKRVPYFKPGKELKEYFTDEPETEAAAGAGTDHDSGDSGSQESHEETSGQHEEQAAGSAAESSGSAGSVS